MRFRTRHSTKHSTKNETQESQAAAIIAKRSRIARPLPIDSDVVAVERRLYRDGKSKYIINGKTARLKDIRDLFLDTGIGADAYSIIEQGKVDRMLLASPTERRVIFEEAAGIAKYRQRGVEASRKLEKTETNLVRTPPSSSIRPSVGCVWSRGKRARRVGSRSSIRSIVRCEWHWLLSCTTISVVGSRG